MLLYYQWTVGAIYVQDVLKDMYLDFVKDQGLQG